MVQNLNKQMQYQGDPMRQLQMQQDNRNNQQFINQLNNPITSNQNYSN